MKKIIITLLLLALMVCTTGCQAEEIIPLTLENYDDYIDVSFDSDIRNEKEYLSAFGYNMTTGYAEISIKTNPYMQGEFNNVVLTVEVWSYSPGWEALSRKEIKLPFDGKSETIIEKESMSSFLVANLDPSPKFEMKVHAISGEFIKK